MIDDVEVRYLTNGVNAGPNLMANGAFNSGLSDWGPAGNHILSSHLPTGGFGNSGGLWLRATGRGEPVTNRVTGNFSAGASLTNGSTASLSARARWRRGRPQVLARLRGNFLESVLNLPVPANLGTPGAANSRLLTNSGPAIDDVSHSPVLPQPGQKVLVTARVHDPDGATNFLLRYRLDPSATLVSVPMNDAGTNGDAIAGDGLFTAPIPAQPPGTLAAFRLEATDGLGATSRFPTAQVMYPGDAEQRESLVRFGEPASAGTFGVYRLWLTKATHDAWVGRSVASNDPLDATFLYGSTRVIYNAGAWYSGAFSSSVPYNSPTGNICAYVRMLAERVRDPSRAATTTTLSTRLVVRGTSSTT